MESDRMNKQREARNLFAQLSNLLIEADIADGMSEYLRRVDSLIVAAFEGKQCCGNCGCERDEQLDRERP